MTAQPIICVGDKTDHGGVVIEGSLFDTIDGKPIARIGNKVTCPKHGCPSTTVIISGDVTCMFDGKAVARHGDKTACGATLISSQSLTTVDTGSAGHTRASSVNQGENPSNSSTYVAGLEVGKHGEDFDQRFLLRDSLTGVPLVRQPYKLEFNGVVIEGETDENGLTQPIPTGNSSESVAWHILGESLHG
ncbi:PAAR domain-containing protein [Uliginosibacterium paludis]|uniref:PAAR domain-containing protein n=1 Tax=Uliginosibacterium paludis TaxID=1615952 RepID=A0ABV2CW23_9RHOO